MLLIFFLNNYLFVIYFNYIAITSLLFIQRRNVQMLFVIFCRNIKIFHMVNNFRVGAKPSGTQPMGRDTNLGNEAVSSG